MGGGEFDTATLQPLNPACNPLRFVSPWIRPPAGPKSRAWKDRANRKPIRSYIPNIYRTQTGFSSFTAGVRRSKFPELKAGEKHQGKGQNPCGI